MAKYIDADLLLKEIEKERKSIEGLFIEGDNNFYDGQDDAYNHTLALIDSLQQEQEEPDKSLEEEVKNYFQGYWPGTDTAEQCNTDLHFTPPAIIRLARHFAKWQKEQMMKDAYVESQIVEDGRIELEGAPLPCLNPIILLPYPQFQPDDKVRIIIVKEDSHE